MKTDEIVKGGIYVRAQGRKKGRRLVNAVAVGYGRVVYVTWTKVGSGGLIAGAALGRCTLEAFALWAESREPHPQPFQQWPVWL